jgi:FtsP/CotA-like multicopper oxidase with cupredoxin domain
LPDDHPQGTYFWHIHRHGSTAMQGWQGMFGYLFVGDENSNGSPFQELASYNIRWEPLAFWEMFANVTNVFSTSVYSQTLAAGQYMEIFTNFNNPSKQQFFYPVNNEFFPEITVKVNIVMLPLLNAQTSAGMAFYILDSSNNLVDFYKFASDGVSYGPNVNGTSVYKQKMLILGPAQRDNVLIKFIVAGNYSFMNQRITPTQRNAAYPGGYSDQATHLGGKFIVSGTATNDLDPMTLVFTAGIAKPVNLTEVVRHTTVTFDTDIQQNKAPFAQFEVNNKMYFTNDTSDGVFKVTIGTAERWTIVSTTDASHPFHIHVNPFQVTGMDVDSVVGSFNGIPIADIWKASNFNPPSMWRDTAFVPPRGTVDLIQEYGGDQVAFAGKTVFHCHYLEVCHWLSWTIIVVRKHSLISVSSSLFQARRPGHDQKLYYKL